MNSKVKLSAIVLMVLSLFAASLPATSSATASSSEAQLVRKLKIQKLNTSSLTEGQLQVTSSGRVFYRPTQLTTKYIPTFFVYESTASGAPDPDRTIKVKLPADRQLQYPLAIGVSGEMTDGSIILDMSAMYDVGSGVPEVLDVRHSLGPQDKGLIEPKWRKMPTYGWSFAQECLLTADPRKRTDGLVDLVPVRNPYTNLGGINYGFCNRKTGKLSKSLLRITKNIPIQERCEEILAVSKNGIFYTEYHTICYSNESRAKGDVRPMEYAAYKVGSKAKDPKPVHTFKIPNVLSMQYEPAQPNLDSKGRLYISTGTVSKSSATVTISRFPSNAKGTVKGTPVITFKRGKYFKVLKIDNQDRMYIFRAPNEISVYQLK